MLLFVYHLLYSFKNIFLKQSILLKIFNFVVLVAIPNYLYLQ